LIGERVRDLCARACIAVLFTLLSVNLLLNFMRTGHVTGLLFLASEALVVVLTLVRRPARLVDRTVIATVTTTLSMAGPPMVGVIGLLRTPDALPLVPDALTVIVSAIGLALVIMGKMTLGRSFGLVPANRGVVVRGPYGFVRHPIYTGYLITHIGFLVANPSPWYVAAMVIADAALIVRALLEERVLSADVTYQGYCQRVGWHLVPGVF
jgi:protein-S-isoprenylcysteine O-methyltransferase Ste14